MKKKDEQNEEEAEEEEAEEEEEQEEKIRMNGSSLLQFLHPHLSFHLTN